MSPMKQYVFRPSAERDLSKQVWPEIATLIEAVVNKRARLQQGLAPNIIFLGRWCSLVTTPSHTSHLLSVTTGNSRLRECIFQEQPPPSAPALCHSPADDNEFFQRIQQIVFGHAFERLRQHIDTTKLKTDEAALVQFCRHIRNGAFHGNKFSLPKPIRAKACWREAVVENGLDGKVVMGLREGFLGLADVIALLHDLGEVVWR